MRAIFQKWRAKKSKSVLALQQELFPSGPKGSCITFVVNWNTYHNQCIDIIQVVRLCSPFIVSHPTHPASNVQPFSKLRKGVSHWWDAKERDLFSYDPYGKNHRLKSTSLQLVITVWPWVWYSCHDRVRKCQGTWWRCSVLDLDPIIPLRLVLFPFGMLKSS